MSFTKNASRVMRNALSILAAAAFVASSAVASDVVPVDLGDLGGDPLNPLSSLAADINDSGQIVGSSTTPSGVTHAFLWQQGVMQDLGSPITGDSHATAINEAGFIAGYSGNLPGGPTQPWVHHGSFTLLPVPSGMSGVASSIAPNGKVAGCIYPTNTSLPDTSVFWDPNANPAYKMTVVAGFSSGSCFTRIDDLARFAGAGSEIVRNGQGFPACADRFCVVTGLDVSGSGKMAGSRTSLQDGGAALVPLYWPNLDLLPAIPFAPTFCNLPNVAGLSEGINKFGEIVGTVSTCDQSNGFQAFFWSTVGESQRLLPFAQGPFLHAVALNSVGGVVGYSSLGLAGGSIAHATFWNAAAPVTVIQLPECLPRPCSIPPEVRYIPARFINDGIPSRPGFDATQINPLQVTLGDGFGHTTRIAFNPDGSPRSEITDVNGDGVLDLKVSFDTTNLIADGVLTPDTKKFELSAFMPSGLPFVGSYPVWVPEPSGLVGLGAGTVALTGLARRRGRRDRRGTTEGERSSR